MLSGGMTQGIDDWTLIHKVLVINTKSVYVFLGIRSDISVFGLGDGESGVLKKKFTPGGF